jgi:molecular chaperone GrpE (heat shock protein)
MTNKTNNPVWKLIVIQTYVPIILSGIILNTLNYSYWKLQERAKKKQLYLQQRIELYSDIAKNSSMLITHLNTMTKIRQIEYKDRKYIRTERLEHEINNISSDLSRDLSKVKIFFSPATTTKMCKFRDALQQFHADKKVILDNNSTIYKSVQELLDQISNETKQDFISN